jgi:hypothetical protein
LEEWAHVARLANAKKANRGSPSLGSGRAAFDAETRILAVQGVVGAEGLEPPTYAL